eukprot:GEMP01014900.1.p1 GENE.GEMP01014900.1~~GEMP01014900.1.p1  ORF type:complete len:332 (-),score=61.58 GEMP01014900.1:1689-2684(-)
MDDAPWPLAPNCYENTHLIGSGSSAKVFIAKVPDGRRCAVKILNLEAKQVVDDHFEEIRKELQAMSSCRHPNIMQHYTSFPSQRLMYVVMPLMEGGSCADLLRCGNPVGWVGEKEEPAMAHVLYETLQALVYLHDPKQAQIHRDLKAGNLLLRLDGSLCLSDFGVAATLRDQTLRQTFVGTPCWMAPEVLNQDGGYNFKADIWSLGITALELAIGEAPYQRLHPLKVMRNIIDKPPVQATAGSLAFRAFVAACLIKEAGQRPTAEQLLIDLGSFFEQRDVRRLVELIRQAPALEERPARNPGASSGRGVSSRLAHSQNSDWDFDLPEEETG